VKGVDNSTPSRFVLPLPRFVLHPFTAVGITVLHIYLAQGHLSKLFAGTAQWTDIWKGFGALAGAYVFAALASRGIAASRVRQEARPEADVPARVTASTANSR
jgi:hypothetical protein